jgi:hypothetical protein
MSWRRNTSAKSAEANCSWGIGNEHIFPCDRVGKCLAKAFGIGDRFDPDRLDVPVGPTDLRSDHCWNVYDSVFQISMEEHEDDLKFLDNDCDGITSSCLRSNDRPLDNGALRDCQASLRNYEFEHALRYLGKIDLDVMKRAAFVFILSQQRSRAGPTPSTSPGRAR